MPREIDKNDVDISKLFLWGAKFSMNSRFGEERTDVFIKIIGDADLNRARVYALRKSAELRKKLRTDDSDERMAFIPAMEDIDKEQLIQVIVLEKIRDFTVQAARNLKFPVPKELDSEANLEEQEKFQAEVDEYPTKREGLIKQDVEKRIEEEIKKLEVIPLETLYKDYERFIINQLCESEMLSKFRDACVFYGTFSDDKFTKRTFKSMEELYELPREFIDHLVQCYQTLDLDGEDLKKLQEVTQ